MTKDITDATFDDDVVERSKSVPVVVDLWAPCTRKSGQPAFDIIVNQLMIAADAGFLSGQIYPLETS